MANTQNRTLEFIHRIFAICALVIVVANINAEEPHESKSAAKTEAAKPRDAKRVEDIQAYAQIMSCEETPRVIGRLRITEAQSTEGVKLVTVEMGVAELKPGKHAVHIHETGKCTPCGAAAGHFDPGPNGNSNPDGNHPFHSGDLVNIFVQENGSGRMHTQTSRITLSAGPLSIFDADGSAVVIHDESDSYCPEGVAKGCAGGSRAACGVIVKR